jgi:acetylornithine deacetylase/succinyl-diaminopimelate desuccinylase-like protein
VVHVTRSIDWASVQDRAQRLLVELIRFDTSNPPGGELEAARHVARVLEDVGLEPVVLESAPGRGNCIARLRGSGSARPLLLIGHLDVVPTEPQHWTHPPFEGLVSDGFIWGRGALDMKYIVATQVMSVVALKEAGVSLDRDLVVASVADEEAGGVHGIRWLLEHHPDLVDCEYALGEFGGFSFDVSGKRFYLCQTGEKGIAWFRMHTRGRPGHGSMPPPDTAIRRLARAVARLGSTPTPLHVPDTTRAMIEGMAAAIPGIEGLLDPTTCQDVLAALPPEQSLMMNAILRNTITVTGLQAGYKHNVIPGEASANLDCRLVPGQSIADVEREIRQIVATDVELEIIEEMSTPPVESRFDTPLFEAMRRNLLAYDPGSQVMPLLLVGGTDGRFLAERGAIYYGYSPIRLPSELRFLQLIHSHDERIPVDAFRDGVKVFVETILDFCAG